MERAKPFIFISAVSQEFDSVREKLKSTLSSIHCGVHVQSDFVPNDSLTLIKLSEYIKASSIVIHFIGKNPGKKIQKSEIRELCNIYPNLIRRFPIFSKMIKGQIEAFYTQVEALMAIFFEKIFINCALDNFKDSDFEKLVSLGINHVQAQHYETLVRDDSRFCIYFDDINSLSIELLRVDSIGKIRTGTLLKPLNVQLISPNSTSLADDLKGAALIEARKEASKSRTSWRAVFSGHYMSRDKVFEELLKSFSTWRVGTQNSNQTKVPCFCLTGRSGDGKSVLMWQLVEYLAKNQEHPPIYAVSALNRLDHAVREIQSAGVNGVIAIDDIQRMQSGDGIDFAGSASLREQIHALIDDGVEIPPIICCGPSPEIANFKRATSTSTEFSEFVVPPVSHNEQTEFERWFEYEGSTESTETDLLAVLLFEINQGQSVQQFAENFKDRLERQNAFTIVRNILAINSLNLAADVRLLENGAGAGAGAGFLQRLSENDQRHFSFQSEMSDGTFGVEFSHPQVSKRMFMHWTVDYDLGRTKSEAFANYLLPSFLIGIDDTKRTREISSAIINELDNVDEQDSIESLLRFQRSIFPPLQKQPNTLAALCTTILIAIDRKEEANIPGEIVKTASALCQKQLTSMSPSSVSICGAINPAFGVASAVSNIAWKNPGRSTASEFKSR